MGRTEAAPVVRRGSSVAVRAETPCASGLRVPPAQSESRRRPNAWRAAGDRLTWAPRKIGEGRTIQEKRRATSTRTRSVIETLARRVLTDVNKGGSPALEIRTRTLSNIAFNEKKRIIELGDRTQSREFFNTAMARKFMQTLLVASGCKTLIGEDKTVSIRQMFYMTKHTLEGSSENTFEDQSESDPIIEDLEVGIDALARSCTLPTGAASSSESLE